VRSEFFAACTLQTHLGANRALSVDDAFLPLREPFDDVQPAPCQPLLVGGSGERDRVAARGVLGRRCRDGRYRS
jgi:hypothetical protein